MRGERFCRTRVGCNASDVTIPLNLYQLLVMSLMDRRHSEFYHSELQNMWMDNGE